MTQRTRKRAESRVTAGMFLFLAALSFIPGARGQDADALHARRSALHERLADNQFGRPLVLESTLTEGTVKGDIYAIVAQPYPVVGHALRGMDHWCDILILHVNVKNCRASGSGPGSILSVAVGRKFDQPLAAAYQLDFAYRVAAIGPDYLEVLLDADAGPLGTSAYRMVLEAAPLDAKSSFVHMSYAYTYGTAARVAMRVYLATLGRDKVGFSIVGRKPDGTPVYLGDMRGVIERNTMRYYLAIEAYLGAHAVPAAQRPEKRLRDWFAAVERYPRQLHDMELGDYLSMKRKELARQHAISVTAN